MHTKKLCYIKRGLKIVLVIYKEKYKQEIYANGNLQGSVYLIVYRDKDSKHWMVSEYSSGIEIVRSDSTKTIKDAKKQAKHDIEDFVGGTSIEEFYNFIKICGIINT